MSDRSRSATGRGDELRQGRSELVLLSGGIDSATALALACQRGAVPTALHIGYGQGAVSSEARAAPAIAAHYGVPYQSVTFSGLRFGAGEIRGRNALLVHLALVAFPDEAGVVIIGIHGGTPYRDCNPDFVRSMQLSYDFHAGGKIMLAAPFIDMQKSEVFELALKLRVPIDLTYSCEAADEPCGRCMSCLDREALIARA